MQVQQFNAPGLKVTRTFDAWNGASYICWKPNCSRWFKSRKDALKFVAWPAKTPTGDRFREWLEECGDDAATKVLEGPDGTIEPPSDQPAGAD